MSITELQEKQRQLTALRDARRRLEDATETLQQDRSEQWYRHAKEAGNALEYAIHDLQEVVDAASYSHAFNVVWENPAAGENDGPLAD